jgi:hypothetical protein
MNLGKAKDYFSSYYEGSLDRGLKQSFEARLSEDAQLQAEYRAFERTMKDLEAFGTVEIEPPEDLHERIAARLDRAVWEQKRQKSPAILLSWWKGLVVGGVAVAGIFVAIFGMNGFHVKNANEAGLVGGQPVVAEQFSFSAADKLVKLSYPSVNHRVILIRDGQDQVLERLELNSQGIIDKVLKNNADTAQLLSVQAEDLSSPKTYIALPGKLEDSTSVGKGSVKEMALALAAHYGKPVILDAKDAADKQTSWSFTAADAFTAANGAAPDLGLAVEQRASGVIVIQKN